MVFPREKRAGAKIALFAPRDEKNRRFVSLGEAAVKEAK